MRNYSIIFCALLVGACGSTSPNLPRGAEAYTIAPPVTSTVPLYRIGALDVLRISVFREPDLSLDNIAVDASGNIFFPLVGVVQVQGRTAQEVGEEIARRLSERYLRNPQVSVFVINALSQRVTVEGAVEQPGVYEIGGNATLLQAVARAQSPTRVAKLNQIIIFRTVNGQRMGAVFDLNAIRRGDMADPAVLGGDTIVVGFSAVKGALRDFLSAAPLLAIFRPF